MTTEPLDPDKIMAEAEELLGVATPGPWVTGEYWGAVTAGSDSVVHGYVDTTCDACGDKIEETAEVALSPEDAALIAAAPDLAQTVIDLAAEVKTLRGRILVALGSLEHFGLSERQRLDRALAALDGAE